MQSSRSIVVWLLLVPVLCAAGPFDRVDLPDAWEARYWSDPAVVELLKLSPKAIADLVPKQAGINFCRCPVCDLTGSETDWTWSPLDSTVMTCRKCQITLPNEAYPAKVEMKILEETVEVLPGITHHYPYHLVSADTQKYPDERLYLAAKRDDLARQFLAKFVLYAAVRHHEKPDPALALRAAIVLAKFAQVYPSYATHYDQPGRAKFFDRADLKPPYRTGYGTAKWTWTASQNVPLNLVIAYALLRDSGEIAQAGTLLSLDNPKLTIERDLFWSSAGLVLAQPEIQGELGLSALRGVLAVGRLLDDRELTTRALKGLDQLTEESFAYDGLWRGADGPDHRRVVGELDGWMGRLLVGLTEPPMIELARSAGTSTWNPTERDAIQQVSWPSVDPRPMSNRVPRLLGGSGLARLAVGTGHQALDVELRAPGNLGQSDPTRLALRLAVGGREVLGDLDESSPTPTGFDRATVSHNTVVIDGLNQREYPTRAATPALGGDPLFFATDPDFQVARFDDPRAYPTSATRYRQTIVAGESAGSPYLISVFEVHGGLQHDQFLHAAVDMKSAWKIGFVSLRSVSKLLPDGIAFLPTANRDDGRWFVQSYGEFHAIAGASVDRPAFATLGNAQAIDLRVHLLSDIPAEIMTASTPTASADRATLIVRRRSTDGAILKSVFVTVFEPGQGTPLRRVGRVAATPNQVVVYLESADGPEHIVISLEPGTHQSARLSDGKVLAFNGHVARIGPLGETYAGGTSATWKGVALRHHASKANLIAANRKQLEDSRGSFDVDLKLDPNENLAGRVVRVRHGDGTTRGWTIVGTMPLTGGHSRLFLHEEPGFTVEPTTGLARYYQFPLDDHPGPHTIQVDEILRRN